MGVNDDHVLRAGIDLCQEDPFTLKPLGRMQAHRPTSLLEGVELSVEDRKARERDESTFGSIGVINCNCERPASLIMSQQHQVPPAPDLLQTNDASISGCQGSSQGVQPAAQAGD